MEYAKPSKIGNLLWTSSLKAISEFRKYTDQPLTLREGNYAHAVQALNKAIDRAQTLLRC